MRRIQVGVVGVNGMGRGHLEAISKSKKVELVAVCDVQFQPLQAAMKKYAVPGFTDYEKMFRTVPMDGVILILPHFAYPKAVDSAIKHRIHILKEKPLARNFKEAQEMVNKVNESGLVFMLATQRRYHSAFGQVHKYLPKIGRVFLARAQYVFHWKSKDMSWRGVKKLAGGGTLLDMGYHVVDMVVSNLGLPEEVYGYHESVGAPGVKHDTEDTSVVTFRYKNGCIGYLLNSWVSNPTEETVIFHGTKGILVADWQGLRLLKPDGKEVKKIPADPNWVNTLLTQVEHFADCIRLKKKPLTSADKNLANMALIEAAYKSYKTHKPQNPHLLLK